MIEEFIQKYNVIIVPIVGILVTQIIRILSKPTSVLLTYRDALDFGFDLSISSMVLVLSCAHKDRIGILLLLLMMLIIVVVSNLVSRIGWDKTKNEPKLFLGIIVPDIIGILLLIIATLYAGGVIQ